MTLRDQDVPLVDSHELSEKSRRKLQRLIDDLEVTSMPTALRNPFGIVRDMLIELSGE